MVACHLRFLIDGEVDRVAIEREHDRHDMWTALGVRSREVGDAGGGKPLAHLRLVHPASLLLYR